MARPRKYAEPLVRIQPYLLQTHIEWLTAEAAQHDISIGEVLRTLIEDSPGYPNHVVGNTVKPLAAPTRATVQHEWIVDLTSRNVCKHCRLPKNSPSTPLECAGAL